MALISNFVIFSLFITVIYFIGLLTFITDYEENNCEMTYMFEYPQFVKIAVPRAEKLPKYGLYAYSEGKFTEKSRAMRFDGVPVLFIPGNAGSHKQVRSLASVALRKALSSRSRFHFDFFTIDLNNELSGLNGALLNEQTSFLNESIHRVLSLYSESKANPPKSVILIGHSMGGVIAHGLAVSTDYQNIELLITMGSPHRKPTISLDWYMVHYYEELQRKEMSKKRLDKTFITIGAGNYDRLVNSWLTNANSSSINVVSTAVPGVWLSMDHACIVWCKQLVLAVTRALFDSVDINTQQLSTDHNLRLGAFKHHLIQNSGINFQQTTRYRALARFETKGDWIEDIRRQYTATIPRSKSQVNYYMVRLVDDTKHQALFVQAINLHNADWIYACSAYAIVGQSRTCEEAMHLSHRSEIAPTSLQRNKRKHFYLDLFRLRKRYPHFSHVIIKTMPTTDPVVLNVDVHNPADRKIRVDLPNWYSLTRKVLIKETAPEALRYIFELPGLQHIIQQYLLYLEPISCTTTTHQATARMNLPWAHHDSNIIVTEGVKKPLVLRLHNSKPLNVVNSTATVALTLDPTCRYTVSIRSSLFGMMSQLTRYYSPLLVANIAAVILMTFYSQMLHLGKEGRCLNFQSALSMSTKPYYLVTAAKLLSRTLAFGRLGDIFPTPDGQYLVNENLEFLILPLILYVTSVGITYLFSVAIWSVLVLSESTIHKFVARCVTRTVGGAVKWSDWLLRALHNVPNVVSSLLFALSWSTCGGMALCLGMVYYFLKLTSMCQEYLEGLVFRCIKKVVFKFIGLFKNKKKSSQDLLVQNTAGESTQSTQDDVIDEAIKEESQEEMEDTADSDMAKDEKTEQVENESEGEIDKDVNEGSDDNEETDIKLRKTELEQVEEKQDSKKEVKEEPKETKKASHDAIHFHFTIFLLWFIITVINIPSVLTWARNFQYKSTPDPSSVPGIALTICAGFLWQKDLPKPNKLYYKEMGMFLYAMAVVCLVYAPISIYRLPYILTATIIIVTMHQWLAPEEEVDETPEDPLTAEPDPVELISDIKTKIE